MEHEVARAIPPVIDTAADIYEGGRRAWHDVETAGQVAGDIASNTVDFGVRQAERAAMRPVSWAIDRGARVAQGAREAFGWIAD